MYLLFIHIHSTGVNKGEQVLECENHNLEDIITPVRASELKKLLKEVGYNQSKTDYLVKGFSEGFDLHYNGCLSKVKRFSPNLKLRVGSPVELWNKVMKEVQAGWYASPYDKPPFEYFVQSPIGLVPKDKGKKTRLIFHLSYPKTGDSVNSGIPKQFCKVKYPDFERAIELCVQEGVNCMASKSDMSSAFRHVPLKKDTWHLLIMKAEHPVSKKLCFFIDKCLPFGSSISCAIFQVISNAIAFIVAKKAGNKPNLNYLDDYLFEAFLKQESDRQVMIFLQVCE